MRNRSNGFDGDPEWDSGLRSRFDRDFESPNRNSGLADSNSPDEVFGEVGLILVVLLGVILAINMALTALHIA
jgi:hypothetical protein